MLGDGWPLTRTGLFASLLVGPVTCGVVEDASKHLGDERQRVEVALRLTRESAKRYEFTVGSEGFIPTLREQPILQWSNPEQGEVHGNVFLWTHGGRPVLVGSLFKWFSPNTHSSEEFHSLVDRAMSAKYDREEIWSTEEPGVVWRPMPQGPTPAATAVARMVQMRQLARQFSVKRTERNGQTNDMRLLPQPVYRYELD